MIYVDFEKKMSIWDVLHAQYLHAYICEIENNGYFDVNGFQRVFMGF